MVDLLLIQPPIRDFYLTAKRTMPYGLACVAAAAIREGFSVAILDALATRRSHKLPRPPEMEHLSPHFGRRDLSPFGLFHDYRHFGLDYDEIGQRAASSGAKLVGISSLFTPYSDEARSVAEAVRRHHPGARIVVGGHHPTALPESVLEWPEVDFVLRGEGEVGLPRLAHAVTTGGSLDSIPGLGYRLPSGELAIAPPAFADDLERPPATHLLDRQFYSQGGRGRAVVVASRGCPMRCSYCAVGAGSPLPYRRRSVASVVGEIAGEVEAHGASFIDFEDENLALDRDWFLELLDQLDSRLGGASVELRAMNGLMPHTIDAEVAAAMKRAGFRELNLSLGSSVAEQQHRFRRPDQRAAFDRALGHAAAEGMTAVGYIVAAAPGQDPLTSVADLLFLATRRVLVGLSIYYPAPGSEDFERCRAAGLLPAATSLMRATALPIADRTSRLDAATLLRLARIVNFMKQLLDDGEELPPAAPLEADTRLDPKERRASGRALLAGFLADGAIRGLSKSGRIFDLPASRPLVTAFLDGLAGSPVRGCR